MNDSSSCRRHLTEVADGTCRECRHLYCANCLVYPSGPNQPPYCVSCALALAGVRASARVARKRTFLRRRRDIGATAPAMVDHDDAAASSWADLDQRWAG